MSELMRLLLIYLALMNLASFAMYGADKAKAIRNSWRIPENALLMSAVLFAAMAGDKHRARRNLRRTPEARLFLMAALGGDGDKPEIPRGEARGA